MCATERDRELANKYVNEVREMTLFILLLSLKFKFQKMQRTKYPDFYVFILTAQVEQ